MEPKRAQPPHVLAQGQGSRVLLFDYAAGEGLPPHTHPDQQVVFSVLKGRVRLSANGEEQEVGAGEVVTPDIGGTFSSQALEDGTRVLVSLIKQ